MFNSRKQFTIKMYRQVSVYFLHSALNVVNRTCAVFTCISPMIPPLFGKQEVGIWRVKKRFPRYEVPIWSLWPNIRSLPSIVAEKNATKNEHICSGQTKDYEIGIFCFSAKHAALRRKNKDWLARNHDNVSEWGDMPIQGLFFQWASS
jgi:hypothetical protein